MFTFPTLYCSCEVFKCLISKQQHQLPQASDQPQALLDSWKSSLITKPSGATSVPPCSLPVHFPPPIAAPHKAFPRTNPLGSCSDAHPGSHHFSPALLPCSSVTGLGPGSSQLPQKPTCDSGASVCASLADQVTPLLRICPCRAKSKVPTMGPQATHDPRPAALLPLQTHSCLLLHHAKAQTSLPLACFHLRAPDPKGSPLH